MPETAPQTQPIGAPVNVNDPLRVNAITVPSTGVAPQPPSDLADAETQERQDASLPWQPPQTRDQYDRMVRQTLARQKQQLEPSIREQVALEFKPQLDELTVIKESQKTEFERLTGQVTQLTTEKLTLAEKAAAADRKDMIYAVLSDRAERLPTKFWPLIEGSKPEEVAASIDSLMADAKALAGGSAAAQPLGAPLNTDVGLGSPASPPATLQPRPPAPINLEEASARLDAIRRGDPDAVAANIKEHLPQVGPRR